MTLPQVNRIFEYWRKYRPPVHESMAAWIGFEPHLTIEERWEQGEMGPEDFAAYAARTGGKVQGAPLKIA